MEFTYSAYKDLLEKLNNNGYKIADYFDYDKFDRCAILRHDIDYSLEKAYRFAEIENTMKVKSTYFVLLTTPFYNVFSREKKEILKEIKCAGHEIGLHFDELNYNKKYYEKRGGLKNVVLSEIKLLEEMIGEPVKAVSMHRPSKETLEADYDFSPVINSYSKLFFNEFEYVSDSRRRWREDVNELIECNKYNRLHILTHAFWYNETDEDIKTTIRKFVLDANKERYHDLDANITQLKEILSEEEIYEK